MSKFAVWVFFALISCPGIKAQEPLSSSEIYAHLQKLKVLGSVLYFAAHPDDENTRLITYLAKEKQYRTGYLSMTRGDGGQNLIGNEQGIELGMIRTQELLAARRIDGGEQFFSRAYDFGFSKSMNEALNFWNHDRALSDAVWVIRNFHPDVIITRFPADERAGHGHHQASAFLAKEAFYAAADATKFPEQLKYGVKPWQAKRLFWNVYNFGNVNADSFAFKTDIGNYNPLLGESNGEIASQSRSQHRSQGYGSAKQRGQSWEYFQLTAGDKAGSDIMDGVVTTWQRVSGGNNIEQAINNIISTYNFEHPEKSVDSLVGLYKQIEKLPDGYWRNKKLAEVQQLVFDCAGLFAEATTDDEYAVRDNDVKVNFFINNRSNASITLESAELGAFDSTMNAQLPVNQNISFTKAIHVDAQKEFSQPYWLQKPIINVGSFDVDDIHYIGHAENDAAFTATFTLVVDSTTFFLQTPVRYKSVDPAKGEEYQPLVITTPVTVALAPNIIFTNISPVNDETANPLVTVQYKSYINALQTPVTIKLDQGNKTIFKKDTIVNFEEGKVFVMNVPVKNLVSKNDDKNLTASVVLALNKHTYTFTHYMSKIQYDHIPHIHYFYHDNVAIINNEIKIANINIGYITGAGDKLPDALKQEGYNVTILNEQDITADKLKAYDAIVTGVRAYDVHDWLSAKYDVLMQFVQSGGNLIVQYNRDNKTGFNNNTKGANLNMAPYPFHISSTRVTDETAAITFTMPQHPALNTPNKITKDDFNNWIQERSIYQAEQTDAHYEMPLSMHDASEAASSGSLIIAKYGNGNFVYTGLVFFRELPAAVPGAYKLFANLIALPKNAGNE